MTKGRKKTRQIWTYSIDRPPKPKVPEDLKAEVTEKARKTIEELKNLHIKEPPEGYQWNYIVDLYTKWHGSYFYFCTKYACPGPNAISPFFEQRFARMGYIGNRRFDLSYMRHTGEWMELEHGLIVDECLRRIKEDRDYEP